MIEVRFHPAGRPFPRGVRLAVCVFEDDEEIDLYNTTTTRARQRRIDASVGLTAALSKQSDKPKEGA